MEPVYISNAVRCPQSESDIVFIWDVRSGAMRAGISTSAAAPSSATQDADHWCNCFNLREKHFDSLHEANHYVAQYDTWFHIA